MDKNHHIRAALEFFKHKKPAYEETAERFFEGLAEMTGLHEAKRVFLTIAKRVPRQPKGAHDPERDRELLKLYRDLPSGDRGVRGLARKLHNKRERTLWRNGRGCRQAHTSIT